MSSDDRMDHYETLQVSTRADLDTIERVFRHLAKRFHPDNSETGDPERFSQIVTAYRTLSDPEKRAAYDARYGEIQKEQWRIFDQADSTNNVESDRRIRLGILTLLYQAIRRDIRNPGVGIIELERILDCPRDHMEFHVWYLKERGWITRLDTGHLAITVLGVDHLDTVEIPWSSEAHQLPARASDREDPARAPTPAPSTTE
jgi:hypothetical protein